jgi:hypothetical protein
MGSAVVESYLDAIVGHDWDALRAAVTDDIVRVGPFGDTFTGRDDYVGFISSLMPTLPGYGMDVSSVTYVDGGSRAVVELAETVEVDGAPTITREVLVLELTGEQISRIDIYIQRAAAEG